MGVDNHSSLLPVFVSVHVNFLKKVADFIEEPTQFQQNPTSARVRGYSDSPLNKTIVIILWLIMFIFICTTQPCNNKVALVTSLPANICAGPSAVFSRQKRGASGKLPAIMSACTLSKQFVSSTGDRSILKKQKQNQEKLKA